MPELLAITAGAIISLSVSYIPGLAQWFAALDGTQKRGVLFLAMLLSAAILTALSCAGYIADVQCTEYGILEVLKSLGIALMANQSTYVLTPGAAKRRDITPDVE